MNRTTPIRQVLLDILKHLPPDVPMTPRAMMDALDLAQAEWDEVQRIRREEEKRYRLSHWLGW